MKSNKITPQPPFPRSGRKKNLHTVWRDAKLVITAGPTREPLDPVRYLSNESSGKMGWALARTAQRQGARVTIVAGPTNLPPVKGVRTVRVQTALQMRAATLRAARGAIAVIGSAAVADWRPIRTARSKIKKGNTLPHLQLAQNPDILKSVARARRGTFPRLAGFALETDHLLARARKKLTDKSLDWIVANPPSALGGTRTTAWILSKDSEEPFRGTKEQLARRILARMGSTVAHYQANPAGHPKEEESAR